MIKSYKEALDTIFKIEQIKDYSLKKVFKAVKLLKNPEKNFKIIHVAWTNWKWSVSRMLFSVLKTARKKVWIFTSPHLVSIRERFEDNEGLISEDDFVKCLNKILDLKLNLSYFEICFLIALLYFAEKKCEYLILEVWMWWRLDATNIVTPIVTAITSIWFDHEEFLWDSLEEISREKAWIIKEKIPIFLNHKNKEIEKIAKEKNSPLFFTDKKVKTNLFWEFQEKNAGLAYEISKYLKIDEKIILKWLNSTINRWRLEFIKDNILLDWAHNKDSLKELKNYIEKNLEKNFRNIYYCFSIKKWKNPKLIFDIFWKDKNYIWFSYKSKMREDLTKSKDLKDFKTKEEIINLASKNKKDLFVVFGSLYMIGIFIDN